MLVLAPKNIQIKKNQFNITIFKFSLIKKNFPQSHAKAQA